MGRACLPCLAKTHNPLSDPFVGFRHLARMKSSSTGNPSRMPGNAQPQGLRLLPITLVFFLLGAATTFLVMRRSPSTPAQESQRTALSTPTKSILHRLDSPVEIRFYSLLDPA